MSVFLRLHACRSGVCESGACDSRRLCLSLCSRQVLCLWVVLAMCLWDTAVAASPGSMLNDMGVPEGTTLQMVSDNTIVNGRPVGVATLETAASVESVLGFYRARWATQGRWAVPGREDVPAFIESQVPGWRMISRLVDDHHVVVQLSTQQGDRTTGLVSIAPLQRGASPVDHGVFSSLDLLSSNLSVDGVDTSSMRVYGSNTSSQRTRDRYRDKLLRLGWQLLADTTVDGGLVTQLGRNNVRLELTFMDSPEFASVVVVHEVTSE